MALISELVSELGVMSGVPERSVGVMARHLREAGLLSQKGRGRGAAHASALDAARLCIALMVGGKAKDAPQAVRDFGQLRSRLASFEPEHRYSEFNLNAICGLGEEHSFEDGLAGLIAVWADEAAVDRMEAATGSPLAPMPGMLARVHDSTLTAEIYFGVAHYCYDHPALLAANQVAVDSLDAIESWGRLTDEYLSVSRRYFSGIRSAREISGVEIRPLGEVVAGIRPAGHRETEDEARERLLRAFEEDKRLRQAGEAPDDQQ